MTEPLPRKPASFVKDTFTAMVRRRVNPPALPEADAAAVAKAPAVVSAKTLNRLADEARDRGDWSAAASHYGKLLALKPDRAGLWLQHGHMLKEAGLLAQAGKSYSQALSLSPQDAEITCQIGLLAKQLGRFTEARHALEGARSLGYADAAFLDRELRFLDDTESRQSRDVLLSAAPATPVRIYMSSAARLLRQETVQNLGSSLGVKNYSYAFSAKGFRDALDLLDLPFDMIDHPEFIPDIRQRSRSEVNIHLGFYPPDAIHLLKGAYNIMVMAWEFERLQFPHEQMRHHAFANPATMLTLPDEVWCVSQFGTEALRSSGSFPVLRTVPAPIVSGVLSQARRSPPTIEQTFRTMAKLDHVSWRPLAVAGSMQTELYTESKRRRSSLRSVLTESLPDEPPMILLSVLNVFDARKQIKPVLEAFIQYTLTHSNAYLLLKVSFPDYLTGDPNEALFLHQVLDPGEVAPFLISDRVWITADVLSRDDLNTLYDLAAFYVSTPHGEGQNLPLLEAMGRGVVPIAVDNTAMRDYISDDNAVVVPSHLRPFTPRLSRRYGLHDISTYYVDAREVLACLHAAGGLPVDDYARRSAAALQVVRERYGVAHFQAALNDAIVSATEKNGRATAPSHSRASEGVPG